jgi:hypothetical protein
MTDPHETTTGDRPKRRRGLLVGGAAVIGAGSLLALPMAALAQDDDGSSWVDDALSGLVEDGTLTQAQVDAVEQALEAARPERGPGFGHHGGPFGHFLRGPGLDDAAEAIGIEMDELMQSLRDGQTLAQIAEANGVEPQAVIDAMVAAAQERIDAAVAAGRLDDAEAAERTADVTQRITELVNEGFQFRHGEGPPNGDEELAPPGSPDSPDSPGSTEAPTTTTG